MLRVGLTGGIACGKSYVRRRLAQAGFHVLDLDEVAHEVTAPGGPAYADVVQAFGPGIVAADGTIDRRALGAIVFADAEARARLNALVHPRIRDEEARRAAALPGDGVLVVDAALLVETGAHLRFDRLIVVHCAEPEQLRRLMARDGLAEAAARARLAAQMPTAEKRRFAHHEVDSSGSFEDTERAVAAVAAELERLAAAPPARVEIVPSHAAAALLHGPAAGPGGLRPVDLVREMVARGGIDLPRLARQLVPAKDGPWYGPYPAPAGSPGPEALAAPLVLWSLSCRGDDTPFLLSVVASVARLTHSAPADLASACLFALAVQAAAVSRRTPPRPAEWAEWTRAAERWGGGPPDPRIEAVVIRPGSGSLALALAGMAGRLAADDVPEDLRQAVLDLQTAAVRP